MTIDTSVGVTPTETLILELLIARFRLGEKSWPLPVSVSPQIATLEKKGFLRFVKGRNANTTVTASLTEDAIALLLSHDYVPPIAEGNAQLTAIFKGISEDALRLKDRQKVSVLEAKTLPVLAAVS